MRTLSMLAVASLIAIAATPLAAAEGSFVNDMTDLDDCTSEPTTLGWLICEVERIAERPLWEVERQIAHVDETQGRANTAAGMFSSAALNYYRAQVSATSTYAVGTAFNAADYAGAYQEFQQNSVRYTREAVQDQCQFYVDLNCLGKIEFDAGRSSTSLVGQGPDDCEGVVWMIYCHNKELAEATDAWLQEEERKLGWATQDFYWNQQYLNWEHDWQTYQNRQQFETATNAAIVYTAGIPTWFVITECQMLVGGPACNIADAIYIQPYFIE